MSRESGLQIALVRHGRPAVDFSQGSPDQVDWIEAYDLAGIDPRLPPPDAVKAIGRSAAYAVSSDLRRAIESLQAIGRDEAGPAESLYREVELRGLPAIRSGSIPSCARGSGGSGGDSAGRTRPRARPTSTAVRARPRSSSRRSRRPTARCCSWATAGSTRSSPGGCGPPGGAGRRCRRAATGPRRCIARPPAEPGPALSRASCLRRGGWFQPRRRHKCLESHRFPAPPAR